MKSHKVRVRHILDAMVRIDLYLDKADKETFMSNFLLQDGVFRQLGIIGEASRNISEELQKKFPDIPWRKIIGMRNKLIHEYIGVDLETVWTVVVDELPELKKQMLLLLDHTE